MLTTDQLANITWVLCETRRTTYGCAPWDSAGTRKAVSDIMGSWAYATALDHGLAHARDPKARTPFAMKGTAPTLAPLDRHPHPLRAGDPDECRTHKGQHVSHCSGCSADDLGPRDDDLGPPLPADMDGLTGLEKFRQARAALDLRMALEARPKEDA